MRGRVVVICAAPILRDTRIGVNQGILQILNAWTSNKPRVGFNLDIVGGAGASLCEVPRTRHALDEVDCRELSGYR